jgi:quercetin dioxygenase-like cupin family protein
MKQVINISERRFRKLIREELENRQQTNESASRDCNCGCNDCNKPKKYESKRPFIEKRISENVIMRTFDHTLSADEYVWHRDRNDRVVTVLEGRDWYLQHDNQLPQKLEEGRAYRIPRGTWHRIIKGSTHLNVMITEAKAKHR